MRTRKGLPIAGVALAMALVASPSAGYIHFPPPTLRQMCKQSTNVLVLTVKKHDKGRGVIVIEATETFKGENRKGMSFRHVIGKAARGTGPVLDWVGDGKQAVMFTIENGTIACGYVFLDKFCYSVDYNKAEDFWLLIRVDPEMRACFHGTVKTLRRVTKNLLDGKDVTVPVDESARPLSLEERRKRAPALNEILKKNRGQ
jgi:hypothetical protein